MEARVTDIDKSQRTLVGEVQQTFRSLRHRNFRIYFFGQLISLCGTWMQNLALSWLVYRLTHSAFLLGVVEFANLSPVLMLALVGGWVADHKDRRKVLLVTQSVFMLQAIAMAYLTLTNQITVWQIIALAAVGGIAFAFEVPSRQALIVHMVEREDFVNAISLNSSLFNGTRVIGPALAALVVKFSGEGMCFAVNAVSYLAALTAIWMLVVPHDAATGSQRRRTVWEGLKYSFGTPEVRRLLRITALLNLFGAQFSLLMPVIAKTILHQDVEGFGVLKSAAAIGSVTAALCLANRGSAPMLNRGVGAAGLGFGIILIGFALSQNFLLTAAFALLLGFCMTFQLSGSHSLLQISVPDELRGRLMSVWTMLALGVSPVGSLMVGWAASQFGAPAALSVAAAVTIVSSLVYLIFKR